MPLFLGDIPDSAVRAFESIIVHSMIQKNVSLSDWYPYAACYVNSHATGCGPAVYKEKFMLIHNSH
tara:strand:- start:462 stop:659 length:198 start_codon:yes stop_codon:yes gene_type:complete